MAPPAAGGGAGIGQLLNAKVAGVPAWAAVAALVGGVLVIRKLGLFGGSSSSTQQQPNVPNQGIPSGFVPAPPPPAPTPPTPAAPTNFGQVTGTRGGGWLHAAPDPASNVIGFLGSTPLTISGPPVSGSSYSSPTLGASNLWLPLNYAGSTAYIWAPEAIVQAPPAQGGAGVGGRGGGSRSAVLMHHGHPLIKQRVRFPHYHVVGRGGPSTVHAVAHAAGLHPARVMALNPHLREGGYRLHQGAIVRIA